MCLPALQKGGANSRSNLDRPTSRHGDRKTGRETQVSILALEPGRKFGVRFHSGHHGFGESGEPAHQLDSLRGIGRGVIDFPQKQKSDGRSAVLLRAGSEVLVSLQPAGNPEEGELLAPSESSAPGDRNRRRHG